MHLLATPYLLLFLYYSSNSVSATSDEGKKYKFVEPVFMKNNTIHSKMKVQSTITGLATITKRESGQEEIASESKSADIIHNETRFFLYKSEVAQSVVDTLSVVSGMFSIWLWAENRGKLHELNKGELRDEWSSELESLNSRLENFVYCVKLLICRLDSVHTDGKNSLIGRDCDYTLRQQNNYSINNACTIFSQHASSNLTQRL